jgi:glucose uptake protein GlcU
LWGWLLFRELEGASAKTVAKVVLGAVAIMIAAVMLGFGTIDGSGVHAHGLRGIVAAAGASLMWGTMYVPYRKAYLSGMNPLSFVTAFTFGELGMVLGLTLALNGGLHSTAFQLFHNRAVLFWLFLGGFVWVVGDLFQQFAVKYVGIGRGIPLSNTNQLWGLAWGALVFHELAGASTQQKLLTVIGSIVMILGAVAIGTAAASTKEQTSRNKAVLRECDRYGLDYNRTLARLEGDEFRGLNERRRWWDYAIVLTAAGVFLWLGARAVVPVLAIDLRWVIVLAAILLASLIAGTWFLYRRTRFD